MSDPVRYAISLQDVYVEYPDGDGAKKVVLNDIDLHIRAGEFATLVGPSGAGKSTLFRLILASEKPTRGRVLIDGEDLDQPTRDCGIVYQRYSLFPHLKVWENVVFGLDLLEFSLPARLANPWSYRKRLGQFRAAAQEYLQRVGLGADADKFPYQLSGGMQQRVAIIQALMTKPKVLLMDEPFGALDDSTRQEMQLFILEQWKATAMTIVFVTHDLEEALFLGTRVLVLSQYYSTDNPHSAGSKIVKDRQVPGGHPKPTDFKYRPEFCALIEEIRHEGLDPDHRQHITAFDLTHCDAFRTVAAEEWKQA
jgi:NitT/TauT family transport system ATP-binding protein